MGSVRGDVLASDLFDAELGEIIGSIYDCVLDPGRWHPTLDRIRLRLGFHNSGLAVLHLAPQIGQFQVRVNIPDEMAALAERYGSAVMDLWGGMERISTLPLEEPMANSHVVDPALWADNPYYREFAVPQGLVDQVGIMLAMDKATVATLAFGRHESAPPMDDRVFDELRLLAPHLRRAVVIGRILEVTTDTARNFAAALDASLAGVVLVDAQMRILHANRAAETMLLIADPIRDTGGRLELAQDLAPGQLEAAVTASARDEGRIGRRGIGIPTRRRDGSPLTLNVMPLARRGIDNDRPRAAAAAIFIADPSSGSPPPADVLSLLFDLTPAESRIFDLISAGHATESIAIMLGITPSTLRTHLKSVFAKTGRHSRGELVRLAAELQVPA